MCGISGIIDTTNNSALETDIKKITDLIKHRGPDDEGYFICNKFAFGHRRLAILDLSAAGHQPMHYLDRYVLIYNGEVYNYLELRDQLVREGYIFHTETDTEVILAAYDRWGENCVNHFNGMWAFALFDRHKDIIFCSRDRFGVKPFYYTKVDGKFIFGSEIKQLLEFYPEPYVNQSVLIDYLVVGYEDHTDSTFFDNNYKLRQSHNLIYDLKNDHYNQFRYYSIQRDLHSTRTTDRNAREQEYQKCLERAVALRLRSDVKVGTCLSGGLDSSSIAAMASSLYVSDGGCRFTAIHAKSSESGTDESRFAKHVAAHCNLDLHIVEPSAQDFVNHVDELVYTQEEPFASPSVFMQYFVMEKARLVGCAVMLDGQGGDETLLGYERYYPSYIMSLKLKDRVKAFFLSSRNSKLSLKQLVFYFLYFTNYRLRLFKLHYENRYVRPEYRKILNKEVLRKSAHNYLNSVELQKQEIFTTQMPHLLRYEDKNSMRHSVESRLPFIDYKTLEKAISLDIDLKISGGWTKYVLRKVVETLLPKEIVWRKNKLGFNAPEELWLNTISDDMQRTIASSSILNAVIDTKRFNIKRLSWKKRWRLYNIAKWQEAFGVRIR